MPEQTWHFQILVCLSGDGIPGKGPFIYDVVKFYAIFYPDPPSVGILYYCLSTNISVILPLPLQIADVLNGRVWKNGNLMLKIEYSRKRPKKVCSLSDCRDT